VDQDVAEAGDLPPLDLRLEIRQLGGQPLDRFAGVDEVAKYTVLNQDVLRELLVRLASRVQLDAADASRMSSR